MVWYIRSLKPPKIDQRGHVRALITITTDLGDGFYPTDLTLYAMITTTGNREDWMSEWQTLKWKNGMRTLWVDIVKVDADPPVDLRLVVNSKRSTEGNNISVENIPEILGIWSDVFGKDKNQAGSMTERRYRIDSGPERVIMEETGESIARHIWDAGIALVAFLSTLVPEPQSKSGLARLLRKSTPRCPRILELGSGCGIVGSHLADLCPTSEVLFTDLPDAMGILNHNVNRATSVSSRSELATAILDWEEPLPDSVAKRRFDLMILSDCTYNSGSIPGLVKTLGSVAQTSPDVVLVVSLKVRHDSEAIFFDLMADADFIEAEHTAVPLPDRCRSENGQELEVVDVHVYRCRKSEENG